MKKGILTLMCMVVIMAAGTSLMAQEVTIVLNPGWTWISYPSTDTVDFATAFGSFTPAVGDIFKSRWGSATYTSDGQWRGSISQLYPGYGYHYKSNRTVPVMVAFYTQPPVPQVIVTTTEPTDIATNSATCGGNVASSDGNNVFVILKGICWSTNSNPTFNDSYIEVGSGIGSFTASMTGLALGTTYHVRAFAVTETGTFYGNEILFNTQTWSNGILPGAFSVSTSQQVFFSQGNLQYQASTDTWRFATNQYDYVGSANSNISSTYSGWIDLFGWGTSGYHDASDPYNVNYQPWSTSTSQVNSDYNYFGYGPSINMTNPDLTGTSANYDWGVYNPINNGGNTANQWRTLSYPEWDYVFNTRTTVSGIRYAKAQVNNVNGMILLPDDWSSSTYSLSNTNKYNASFSNNIISASQWAMLENAGAVFLPAAGGRNGTSVPNAGSSGSYQSTSYYEYDNSIAWGVYFSNSAFYTSGVSNRFYGFSVRLVRDTE